eukprot:COSAG03_NODE_3603_length_1924_cov_25.251507_1_plen_142_part_10
MLLLQILVPFATAAAAPSPHPWGGYGDHWRLRAPRRGSAEASSPWRATPVAPTHWYISSNSKPGHSLLKERTSLESRGGGPANISQKATGAAMVSPRRSALGATYAVAQRREVARGLGVLDRAWRFLLRHSTRNTAERPCRE